VLCQIKFAETRHCFLNNDKTKLLLFLSFGCVHDFWNAIFSIIKLFMWSLESWKSAHTTHCARLTWCYNLCQCDLTFLEMHVTERARQHEIGRGSSVACIVSMWRSNRPHLLHVSFDWFQVSPPQTPWRVLAIESANLKLLGSNSEVNSKHVARCHLWSNNLQYLYQSKGPNIVGFVALRWLL
jgi:hypothetical protein